MGFIPPLAALAAGLSGAGAAAGATAAASGVTASILGGSAASTALGAASAGLGLATGIKSLVSNPKPPSVPQVPTLPSIGNARGGTNSALAAISPGSVLGGTATGSFSAPSGGYKTLLGG
jgi:hypothetical protein